MNQSQTSLPTIAPGYDIAEQNGHFYPIRLECGLKSDQAFCGYALRAYVEPFADGKEGYPFVQAQVEGGVESYQYYGLPTRAGAVTFLEKWVILHGGLADFEAAWAAHQQAPAELLGPDDPPDLAGLVKRMQSLADTYTFITAKVQRCLDGHLTAEEVRMIFAHQFLYYQDDERLQDIYAEALHYVEYLA